MIGNSPYAVLPPIFAMLAEAKAEKGGYLFSSQSWFTLTLIHHLGLTFDQIGKAIGKDEVWVASAFNGQVIYLRPWFFPRTLTPVAQSNLG